MQSLAHHRLFGATILKTAIAISLVWTALLVSPLSYRAHAQDAVSAGASQMAPEISHEPAPAPAAASPQDAAAPGPASTPQTNFQPTFGAAELPRDLSPWKMFMDADLVVKAVMIGLAFASLVTWTVWLAKTIELGLARRRLRSDVAVIATERSLPDAAQRLAARGSNVDVLIDAAASEIRASAGLTEHTGVKERVALKLSRLEAAAGRRMTRGTGVLATIGATAPFVGLFGTVWGIMNSFIGISKAQTTNLAVVAPGIAEALLATAIGLVAAIPAVIIYNHFARSISSYKALLADASAEVLRLVSRDIDRNARVLLARVAE